MDIALFPSVAAEAVGGTVVAHILISIVLTFFVFRSREIDGSTIDIPYERLVVDIRVTLDIRIVRNLSQTNYVLHVTQKFFLIAFRHLTTTRTCLEVVPL